MVRWGSSGRSTTEEFLKERNAILQHKASHLLSPVPHGTDTEFCSQLAAMNSYNDTALTIKRVTRLTEIFQHM